MSKFLDYLINNENIYYRPYLEKLKVSNIELKRITVPVLRDIAKEIVTSNQYENYLKSEIFFHQEKLLKGLVIGYLKLPFNQIETYLRDFVHIIDDWDICDSTVSTLKIFKKNLDTGLEFIKYCFDTNEPYAIRFAYVLLLNYYLQPQYLDYIFDKVSNEKCTHYHVQMAVAWLISYLYIKFPQATLILLDGRLDRFTHNKAISKICESFRVPIANKELAKTYRRN